MATSTIPNTINDVCTYFAGNPRSISAAFTVAASSYKDVALDISSSPTKARILSGFSISGNDSIVPMQIYFNGVGTIQCRLKNVSGAQQTGTLYVWYI